MKKKKQPQAKSIERTSIFIVIAIIVLIAGILIGFKWESPELAQNQAASVIIPSPKTPDVPPPVIFVTTYSLGGGICINYYDEDTNQFNDNGWWGNEFACGAINQLRSNYGLFAVKTQSFFTATTPETYTGNAEGISMLQRKLASVGYLTPSNINGVYDTATQQAIVNLQKRNFISENGKIGTKTLNALNQIGIPTAPVPQIKPSTLTIPTSGKTGF